MLPALVLGFVVVAMITGTVEAKKPNVQVPTSEYESFCHYGQAVKNPYQVKPFSTTFQEVNGEGANDHTQHDGPIATSPQVAQELKNQHIQWGDIIPPVFPYLPEGLNWTVEGQAIYNNNCEYDDPNFDLPLISADVDCAVVDGVQKVRVTLTNEGNAAGVATVNGDPQPVAANSTVNLDYDNNTTVTVVIDGQEVFNEVVTCGGRGADEDPETPVVTTSVKPQVDAPTGGVGAGAGQTLTVAAMVASVVSLGYGVIRLRKFGL